MKKNLNRRSFLSEASINDARAKQSRERLELSARCAPVPRREPDNSEISLSATYISQ